MANANIETQKKIKKKYGVTITKNMSVTDILEAWNRVPGEIKSTVPTLDAIITLAGVVSTSQGILRTVTSTAKTVYETAKGALEDAASSMMTGGATIVAKASTLLAKEAETVQNEVIQASASSLIEELGNSV